MASSILSTATSAVSTESAKIVSSLKNAYAVQDNATDPVTVSGTNLNDYLALYTNPLLVGENVSWKCSLFTMAAVDFFDYQTTNEVSNYKTYILAETGLTGHYSIDEVNITSLPPGSENTKNGTMTSIHVKMSEVGSLKLYDDLQLASRSLGFGNTFSDLPLFVKISFVGFNSSTHQPYTVPETRLWCAHICDVKCKIQNSGSVCSYDLTLIPSIGSLPAGGKTVDSWVIGQHVEFNAPPTFGEAIAKLEECANQAIDTQYPSWKKKFNIRSTDFIKFNVDPELASLPILNDKQEDTTQDPTKSAPTARKFSFAANQTYANIIDKIADSTKHEDDTATKKQRNFTNVILENKYLGLDEDLNTSVFASVYHVVKLNTLNTQTPNDVFNKNYVTDLIDSLEKGYKKRGGFRIKRYDYLWSGLNTEILHLDLNFDSTFGMAVNRNIMGQYDSHNRKGSKTSQMTGGDPIAKHQGTTTQTTTNSYSVQSPAGSSSNVSTKTGLLESIVQKVITTVDTIALEAESVQATVKSYFSIPSKGSENATASVYTFDDLDSTYDDGANIAPKLIYKNRGDKSSGTDDANSSRTEIEKRQIRSNYYNSSSLINIQLNVVGDPWWLGPSDKEIIYALNNMQKKNAESTTGSNTAENAGLTQVKNERCFLLNLYPAKQYNQETGIATTDPDGILAQCLYNITGITSKFSASGFTQVLTAYALVRSLNK